MPCEHCPHCQAIEAAAAAAEAAIVVEDLPAAPPQPPGFAVPPLKDHQSAIAQDICNNTADNKLHFIEGIAGTGKTYLLGAIYALFKNNRMKVEVISPGPFPQPNVAKQIKKVLALPDQRIEETDVFIVDNGNQITEQLMKCLCEKLNGVMGNEVGAFGGKIVVLAADFGLLQPYTPNNLHKLSESLLHLAHNNTVPFKKHTLPIGTDDFSQFLEMARKTPSVKFPEANLVPNLDGLIDGIYGPLGGEAPYTNGTIVAVKKADVELINKRVIEKMKPRVQVFEANFSARTIKSDLDLHQLRLKKHCILVLDEPAEGLPKGTRLVFDDATRNHLCCRVIPTNQQVDIERTRRFLSGSPSTPSSSNNNSTHQSCMQFPVSLGFAQTINSVQGHRFETLGVFKPENVFDHGMLYTAVSRCESLEGLKVMTQTAEVKNKIEMRLID